MDGGKYKQIKKLVWKRAYDGQAQQRLHSLHFIQLERYPLLISNDGEPAFENTTLNCLVVN